MGAQFVANWRFTKTSPRFEFSLWRIPLTGGEETEVLPLLHRYKFVVTEKAIYHATPSRRESPAEVRELNIVTGKVTISCTLTKRIELGLTVSPDNRHLLFAQVDSVGSDLMSIDNFR